MSRLSAVVLAVLVALAACTKKSEDSRVAGSSSPRVAGLVLRIAYGSEKKTWLEEQARAFMASGAKTRAGKPIVVEGKALGSGEAVQGILDGTLKPHVLSPASGAYITLLNHSWLSASGHTRALCPAGEPVVLSPIVIAIWKPMATALGWPNKKLGWADLMRVNADPRGWGAYGRPEWGAFKLGHTHPEFSNSGLLAVLAEAYAGAHKTRELGLADLDAKKTRDFITAVESTIVHYGKSTGFFGDKMLDRGPSYLSAAVLYENLVIESYGRSKPTEMPVVAIYPVEGTFWSDHPYAVLDADWVSAEEREAAESFLAFLKTKPAQQRALELGFRPADPSIPITAPVDAAHGVDPKQPQTLLDVPNAAVLRKLLDVWKTAKRRTDVVVVIDTSGSMKGRPLEEAKGGAKAFLAGLHDADEVTLMFFDHRLFPPVGPQQLGPHRADLNRRIEEAIAQGGTALYDATAAAYELAQARARKDPARIHAVVVMTDGRDTNSKLLLDGLRGRLTGEDSTVKVFTIAYGAEADPQVLGQIAEAAKGSMSRGSAETIVQVYQDMAAFF